MSIEIDFGQLRSLIMAPSHHNWRLLCGVLDRYEDQWKHGEMSESVLPYLRHHIERWPDAIRRYATHTWLHRAMRNRTVPQLEFVSAFHFVGLPTTERGLCLLFQATNLERVTHIDMRKAEACNTSVVREALNNPFLPNLRSLTLRTSTARRLPQATRLALHDRHISCP